MTHLFADLMREHDVFWAAMLPILAGPAMLLGLLLLRKIPATAWRGRLVYALSASAGMAALTLFAFHAAARSSYPQILPTLPLGYLLSFLGVSLAAGAAAALIVGFGRRSARNVLLAGSLVGSGFSCAMFVGLSGLVAPLALSFDLTAVLTVMMVGSALCSFALWENGQPTRRHSTLYATCLGTGAVMVLSFGSMSSVLSFGDWMNAVMLPDDITSAPVVVIGAAEACIVLALSLVGSLIDNRTAARDKEEADRLHQLADSTFEAIVVHRDGLILDGNANLPPLLGASLTTLIGRDLSTFVPCDGQRARSDPNQPIRTEGEIATVDGRRVPVEMLSRPITYRKSHATITALRDISERRASEARIRFLAHHDALTQLPNRALLTETLEQAVWRSRSSGEPLAVLCLDLDGFKPVNDTFGHAAGDELLRQVAARVRECLVAGEFVARIGGDEFVVLQAGAEQPDAASDLARRIIKSLSYPFCLKAGNAQVGTSIGMAVHPVDAQTPDALLGRADLALYRAKENGRGCFCRFEEGMGNTADEKVHFEGELRQAEAKGEFSLVYQPIFDGNRRIVCFEALLRWNHPTLGAVPPGRFIPVAERRGLIASIGEWVLREACRTAAEWPGLCRVAVNISPVQIERGDLPKLVEAILTETGLAAERLELELTEGVLMEDLDRSLAVLGRLRTMGVRLVLDDFGAGCSSLSYLHRLPFHKLKIDRAFVNCVGEDANAKAIVRAIILLGHELGIGVTAEGVETPQQIEILAHEECREFQGFLLSVPVSEARAHAVLVDQSITDAVTLLWNGEASSEKAGTPPFSTGHLA